MHRWALNKRTKEQLESIRCLYISIFMDIHSISKFSGHTLWLFNTILIDVICRFCLNSISNQWWKRNTYKGLLRESNLDINTMWTFLPIKIRNFVFWKLRMLLHYSCVNVRNLWRTKNSPNAYLIQDLQRGTEIHNNDVSGGGTLPSQNSREIITLKLQTPSSVTRSGLNGSVRQWNDSP